MGGYHHCNRDTEGRNNGSSWKMNNKDEIWPTIIASRLTSTVTTASYRDYESTYSHSRNRKSSYNKLSPSISILWAIETEQGKARRKSNKNLRKIFYQYSLCFSPFPLLWKTWISRFKPLRYTWIVTLLSWTWTIMKNNPLNQLLSTPPLGTFHFFELGIFPVCARLYLDLIN